MKNFSKLYTCLLFVFVILSLGTVITVLESTGLLTSEGLENTGDPTVSDTSEDTTEAVRNENLPVITIDAGHGGYDPGKIGADGTKEKDINLKIALYLRDVLTEQGFTVYLTRDTDISLYDDNASNKKVSDLNNRIAVLNDNNSDLFISIHQNSFSDSSVHGAQVFYYEGSDDGKALATSIQSSIKSMVDESNERPIKGNSEYMILKYSPCTALIVECGFLSNPDECVLLASPEYEQLMAEAIAQGICQAFN